MLKLTLDEGLWCSMPVGISQYQVNGMPDGQKAFITKKAGNVLDPRWALRREKHGVSTDWTGNYITADDAVIDLRNQLQRL